MSERDEWQERVAGGLAFLRRRITGDYHVDEFGFDRDLAEHIIAPPLRALYESWFRVQMDGLSHVPSTGGALIVANHAGVFPIDGAMLALGLLDHHPAHRPLRTLAADLLFNVPFAGEIARKAGVTLACSADAHRLLDAGELVGVFPEGYKGIGKPFSKRYQLQRFGRGGFVATALAAKVPIVPCAIVGSEEAYPKIGELKILARLLGLPYFPITPLFPWLGPLGLVPLPSKWMIRFGEPIDTTQLAGGMDLDDPTVLLDFSERIRADLQQSVNDLRSERGPAFS